jgi:hypothetical protein
MLTVAALLWWLWPAVVSGYPDTDLEPAGTGRLLCPIQEWRE